MMSMVRIGANRDAWGYLLDTVVHEPGDERAQSKSAYYTGDGTPPGRWKGNGIHALGLSLDHPAGEAELSALFGVGANPVTGELLGKSFDVAVRVEDRVLARIADEVTNPENIGKDLDLEEMNARFTKEELAKPQPESVAGFEFVFSPPKSVSSWWALADPALKSQIQAAHNAAMDATIAVLENEVIRTRIGDGGIAQVGVKGISAVQFDHWDSREGDPQLHTHMLVSNKVQGADNKWRTIDSRALYPAVASAGAHYDTVLMDELSTRFGIDWTTQDVLDHPAKYLAWRTANKLADTPGNRFQFSLDSGTKRGSVKWQISGIPQALNNEFSTRSEKINSTVDDYVSEYVAQHGKRPTDTQIIKARQHATLSTRRAKVTLSLKDLTASWRARATKYVGDSFLAAERVAESGKERLKDYPLWSFRSDDIGLEETENVVRFALTVLGQERSTWKRTNAEKAVYDATAHWRFRSADDRRATVNRMTDAVLAQAVALTPKNELHTPSVFLCPDGSSQFHPQAHDLFTTAEVWDAEERLMQAGHHTSGPTVEQSLVDTFISTPTGTEQRILSTDQAAAVSNLLTSGRQVDVLVGPAGAGKTTSLEKLKEIWELQHGHGTVRGLAPTARAAEVLSESLGIETENTAKWLHETGQGNTEKDGFNYTLNAGDLIIVDEASIAGTIALDKLRAQVDEADAKLLLVGDWAQLAAVDAGGAFGLLAYDRTDVAELTELHRFTSDWEAEASKRLRLGRVTAIGTYLEHERIEHGFDETVVASCVDAWKADEATLTATGDTTLTSLLIAPTSDMVERLNDIARQWRVTQGLVDATQTAVIMSGTASPGDRIVTRQNARQLRTDHDRWVKNNDEWVVASIDDTTGDIVAVAGEESVTLPAAYCADHVQLAYATTAHRAQGRTVDTAHTIVDSSASRETFYVGMTRGKLSNKAYVIVDEDKHVGDTSSTGMSRTWRQTLENVLTTRGGDIAAHENKKLEAERIGSTRQLYAEYQTILSDALTRKWLPLLKQMNFANDDAIDTPQFGPLLANLNRIENRGDSVEDTLAMLLNERDLDGSQSVLGVLHGRTRNYLTDMQELTSYENWFAPVLEQFGITPEPNAERWKTLNLYRALTLIEQAGESVEDELREITLSIDRSKAYDLQGLLSVKIKQKYPTAVATDIPDPLNFTNNDRIAGLIERAPEIDEPEIQQALSDRAQAIQIRAELILDTAIADEEPWVTKLGKPVIGSESHWRATALRVACYRDLYDVHTDTPLGNLTPNDITLNMYRELVLGALEQYMPTSAEQVPVGTPGYVENPYSIPRLPGL